jgi:hypothetical protein
MRNRSSAFRSALAALAALAALLLRELLTPLLFGNHTDRFGSTARLVPLGTFYFDERANRRERTRLTETGVAWLSPGKIVRVTLMCWGLRESCGMIHRFAAGPSVNTATLGQYSRALVIEDDFGLRRCGR